MSVTELVIFFLGACAGGAIALLWRPRPAPAAPVIHVTPETIQRAIVASGGVAVHLNPNIIVDWRVIHQTVEGAGYRLVAKHEDEEAAARPH